MESYIKTTGLIKDYGKLRALHGVDLELQRGRIVGLLGKNGAGKSTFLKCLLGLLRHEGDIQILGKTLKDWKHDLYGHVAFIPDVSGLDPRLTVQQTLDFCAGINPRWNGEKAGRLFARSDLPPYQKVGTLSKGMKTKLYLLLTLSCDVDILLLDEPTLGLDIVFRKAFYDLLLGEFFDEDKLVVISTHQVSEVENILDEVVFIDQGKILLHEEMSGMKEQWKLVELPASREAELQALNPKILTRSLGRVRGLVNTAVDLKDARVEPASVSDVFVAMVKAEGEEK
jgi:ABC-2 type transport system ATP-binding protein